MDHEAHIREAETDNLDFDDSANALWSLYGKEAKNLDHATIKDIKSDMDGLLIFVRSYSSTLPLLLAYLLMDWSILRLACSPLPSPRLSSIVVSPYNHLPYNNRRSTSNNRSHCLTRSPSSFPLSVHSPPHFPIRLCQVSLSLRQRRMSG